MKRIYFQINFFKKSFLFLFLFLFSFGISYGANLRLSPSSGDYNIGQNFSVDVLVSNNVDNINGASAVVTFPSDLLEVRSVSKSGSILTIWAEEPTFSNSQGKVSMEGVLLNPGFSDQQGKVVTINFRAKSAGQATINVSSGSVLANDGNGTNVVNNLGSASFNIKQGADVVDEDPAPTPVKTTQSSSGAVVITSSSYPDSTKWYSTKEASFEWKLPSGTTAIRTIYDDKESTLPTRVYDPAITNRSFTVDGNGVFYMNVQARVNGSWGSISHYKFQVDTEAPYALKATFPDGDTTSNPSPSIIIEGEDKTSGLGKVSISVDGGQEVIYEIDSKSLYKMPKSSSGKHTAVITLYDKAGNSSKVTVTYTVVGIAVPVITEYTKTVDVSNKLKVSGTSLSNAKVEILLRDEDGKAYTQNAKADESGIFMFTWEGDLSSGIYDLSARAVDTNGGVSDYSESLVFAVKNIALVRFGLFIMNWLSLLLLLILVLVAIIATFWYSFHQFAMFRKKVKKTVIDVEASLRSGVNALRKDTEEFRILLMKAEKKRDLTKEETTMLKKFNKRLKDIEKKLDDKLDKIK